MYDFLFSDFFLVFWGHCGLFLAMSGWFGVYVRPKICFCGFLIYTDHFHVERFFVSWLFDFLPFLGHFEPFWALSGYLWVGVGPENFFGLYLDRLINFVF